MRLTLYVPARPEPQARPRAKFQTKHVYSTHPDFYYVCFLEATKKAPPRPLAGALRLSIRFMYKRPNAHNFEIYKTTRADLDNLEKAVMDALTRAKWQPAMGEYPQAKDLLAMQILKMLRGC